MFSRNYSKRVTGNEVSQSHSLFSLLFLEARKLPTTSEFRAEAKELVKRLSPKETEVLGYLAQDYSVREVAEALEVRPTTVETHRQSIRSKFWGERKLGMVGLTHIAMAANLVKVGEIQEAV
jgi:FixJ family two-component response regulator